MDYREDCGGELDIDYLQNKIKYLVGSIKYDFSDKTHRDSQFHNKNFLNWFNYFHLKNNGKLKFINIENNFYDNYDKMADTRINTGLMGILHLLSFDITELYIKGFTFSINEFVILPSSSQLGENGTNFSPALDKLSTSLVIDTTPPSK